MEQGTNCRINIYLSITTSDKVDKFSIRGVSMDGVKHRLQQHHGEIYLHFDKDKFCEFEITLPAEWWNVNLLFCF